MTKMILALCLVPIIHVEVAIPAAVHELLIRNGIVDILEGCVILRRRGVWLRVVLEVELSWMDVAVSEVLLHSLKK